MPSTVVTPTSSHCCLEPEPGRLLKIAPKAALPRNATFGARISRKLGVHSSRSMQLHHVLCSCITSGNTFVLSISRMNRVLINTPVGGVAAVDNLRRAS